MAISNSGNDILVDATGVALAGFTNAAASNIKVQDGSIYTITSGAVGSNANGSLVQVNTSGANATLAARNTYYATGFRLQTSANMAPVANVALDVRGARVVFTAGASPAEQVSPMIGDANTQIVYRGAGSTWNSACPGTNLVGSTLIFEGGGDGHLSKHPDAVVKDVKLVFTSTSNSEFVLGMHQNWDSTNKPAPLRGVRLVSVSGNTYISPFTFMNGKTPPNVANNAFQVWPDFVYDVAAPGARPTQLRRSYRRSPFTADASSYWGAVSICPTYLWIDLKTTLSAAGVLDSAPTYLRQIDYNAAGLGGGDTAVDVIAYRFDPRCITPTGASISGANIAVKCTNANCTTANAIGVHRAALMASGSTGAGGRFVITEPGTKVYNTNASYLTDSIGLQNRTKTDAWHKWWEGTAKLIVICDSRNSTGGTAPDSYAANEYQVTYRKGGYVFSSGALDMSAPQSPSVTLAADGNYNAAASTAGITITYAAGVTTAELPASNVSLDSLYKAIIDFHAATAQVEGFTSIPITQDNGLFEYVAASLTLKTTGNASLTTATVFTAGTLLKALKTNGTFTGNFSGINVEDSTGIGITINSAASMNLLVTIDGVEQAVQTGVTTANYKVPSGKVIKWAAWSLGKLDVYGTRTVSAAETVTLSWTDYSQGVINTALDVSALLASSNLILDGSGLTLELAAGYLTTEQCKALLHRLAGTSTGLHGTLAEQGTPGMRIEKDRIVMLTPTFYVVRKSAVLATDISELEIYIDTTQAKAINASYVPNTMKPNGRVEIPAKPELLRGYEVAELVKAALKPNLDVMNGGIKNASLLVPHTTNLS